MTMVVINIKEGRCDMPGGDRTGPMGMGPMTGRGAGDCSDVPTAGNANNVPGRGFARGRGGRGFGRGLGRGNTRKNELGSGRAQES